MKTFTVHSADGTSLQAEQLATFAHHIEGVQFRFVVTRVRGAQPAVTHRASGKSLVPLAPNSVAAALGDYVVAGKAALDALAAEKGAGRVRAVLAQAEALAR